MLTKTVRSPTAFQHFYPQIWLLVVSITTFGLYVAYDRGLLHRIVTVDRSYLSIVVGLLLIIMTLHASWHVLRFSARIRVAEALVNGGPESEQWTSLIMQRSADPLALTDSAEQYIGAYLDELNESSQTQRVADDTETASVLEIYADKLRSPVELGWYVVDLAIRMGLIGTIIGFILIFSSLTGNSIPGVNEMQELLISMSSGMGTALYTTLSGLICATILGMQYMVLARETEHLIALLIRLRNRRFSSGPIN